MRLRTWCRTSDTVLNWSYSTDMLHSSCGMTTRTSRYTGSRGFSSSLHCMCVCVCERERYSNCSTHGNYSTYLEVIGCGFIKWNMCTN